jgi:hypothetical protein
MEKMDKKTLLASGEAPRIAAGFRACPFSGRSVEEKLVSDVGTPNSSLARDVQIFIHP